MAQPMFAVADTRTRTRALVHTLGLVVGAFLAAIAATSVGILILRSLSLQVEPMTPEVRAVVSALQFTGFLLVGLWYIAWADARDLVAIDWPSLRDLGWTVIGVIALILIFAGLSLVLEYLGIQVAMNQIIEAGLEAPRLLLYVTAVTILFTAPAEELVFRGLIQGLFRRAYGVVPGIVIAAAVFGLAHYLALVGTGSKLAYLVIAAVLGLVLGAIYEYTENLFVPIAVHGLYNAYLFLSVYATAV